MIKVEELHKKFGKNLVLKGVELSIDKPGIYAILGPNSSGKTTLIKSILGMVLPDSGEIEVGGQNIKGQWAYRSKLNYLPQIANFPHNFLYCYLLPVLLPLIMHALCRHPGIKNGQITMEFLSLRSN